MKLSCENRDFLILAAKKIEELKKGSEADSELIKKRLIANSEPIKKRLIANRVGFL